MWYDPVEGRGFVYVGNGLRNRRHRRPDSVQLCPAGQPMRTSSIPDTPNPPYLNINYFLDRMRSAEVRGPKAFFVPIFASHHLDDAARIGVSCGRPA